MYSIQIVSTHMGKSTRMKRVKCENCNDNTVDSEIFARILFSRIVLKDVLVMWKIRE